MDAEKHVSLGDSGGPITSIDEQIATLDRLLYTIPHPRGVLLLRMTQQLESRFFSFPFLDTILLLNPVISIYKICPPRVRRAPFSRGVIVVIIIRNREKRAFPPEINSLSQNA